MVADPAKPVVVPSAVALFEGFGTSSPGLVLISVLWELKSDLAGGSSGRGRFACRSAMRSALLCCPDILIDSVRRLDLGVWFEGTVRTLTDVI